VAATLGRRLESNGAVFEDKFMLPWSFSALCLFTGARPPCIIAAGETYKHPTEAPMPTFMVSMNWTDQGIRTIKDAKKRVKAARDLGKKFGVEIKQLWLTNGESDLVSFLEAASGDNVAKFALALGSYGNVHTRTVRAWSEAEYMKLVSELP
jgi:uncharacterized protein with GYD domain